MNSLKSKKRKPTHPGAILREDVLAELNITQVQFALENKNHTIYEKIGKHEHKEAA